MKYAIISLFVFATSLSLAAENRAGSQSDLKVSLLNQTVEALQFSQPGVVSYTMGERTLRRRVVPELTYKTAIKNFPIAESVGSTSSCKPSISIERAGKKRQLICDGALTASQKEHFLNWFKQTRQKLME